MRALPNSQTSAAAEGQRKYNTGKPCKHGHIADRWTVSGACCACTRASGLAFKDRLKQMLKTAPAL
jgi:hypothetical protein